ncbi:MAG TPA: hypothetical protein VMG30_12620 [Acidobacteriota bacterium]|nr:hypothetical protein [Acidobacteriota bacterium]
MKNRALGVFGTYFGFACCLLHSAACQPKTERDPFLVAQQEGLAKNPKGLSFAIQLKDKKTRFRQGEIIQVELSFSSALPKTYQLDDARYDRGGRLGIDSYHVDPADGAVDPLKELQNGTKGGIRGFPILDVKPHLIVRNLNEYVRFDKPGKYRLYVFSSRVGRKPSDSENAGKQPGMSNGPTLPGLIGVPATSNVVEFTILPLNPEWAAKQLKSAEALLESPGTDDFMQRDKDVQAATDVIRYLGTEDSVNYMVRHLVDAETDFGFGLIGSPFPATVVKELENGLTAQDCPVSSYYLWVLLERSYIRKYSHRSLPYPGRVDRARLEEWQQQEAKAQTERRAIQEDYLNRLAAGIANKKGRAKAVSLATLLDESTNGPKETRPNLPAEFIRTLPSQVTQAFFDLPVQTQYWLLEYQWDRIKSPEMLPVLERYCENPTEEKGVFEQTRAGAALKRLFEMDPKRGREQLLRQIRHATGRIRFEILAMLPDKTLPEMDDSFASDLEGGRNNSPVLRMRAQLLARYGTPAILPRIKAALLENEDLWSCDIHAPIIAYLLRVDSAFGAAELESALSPENRKTECKPMLSDVARFYTSSELEALAIRHLDDPDPAVVQDCAEALGRYGSKNAEAPIWRRFEKWHNDWKDRARELQNEARGFNPELDTQRGMEMGFTTALASSPSWLADAEKLKRIQSLCLTESGRKQIGWLIQEAEAPKKRIELTRGPGDSWSFQVVQYEDIRSLDAVKSKLTQFPTGTVFLWSPLNAGQGEEEKKSMFVELKTFLEQLGMSLEEFQTPK